MSLFIATVADIEHIDNLNIVKFDYLGNFLKMMSLDLSDEIQVGVNVLLAVKPSHVAIGKNFSGDVSYSNQIRSKIVDMDNGRLLCSLQLQFCDALLESIITLESSQKMNLNVGDEVVAFIKASELFIAEVLSE